MADDKRVAKLKLDDLLMTLSGDRRYLKVCRNKGDAVGVERYERALKLNHSLIREHCAEHHLKRPHDVPPEDAA
ncbi:MAG: hypothetical protein IH974_01045 [Myxococcales bacterium]|nr:hypothetical protein [Myxococcales bacterium]